MLDTDEPFINDPPRLADYLLFKSGNKIFNIVYVAVIVLVILAIVIPVLTVIIVFTSDSEEPESDQPKTTSATGYNGAVATENKICSEIGVDILRIGGNAMDAAIASALCIGVTNAFSSGMGGGGVMLVHMTKLRNGSTSDDPFQEIIDFREVAPNGATSDMFVADPRSSWTGGLSVGVPGELRGFEKAWEKYGSLPWQDLFKPAIKIAREGWKVQPVLEKRIQLIGNYILSDPGFLETYAPNGVLLKTGDLIKRTKLADLLQKISEEGSIAFYNGSVTDQIVSDLQNASPPGIITSLDLLEYYNSGVRMSPQPLSGYYHGYRVVSALPPFSGGLCIQLALNILERFQLNKKLKAQDYHWILEALAFSFSGRMALGDPNFVNLTHVISEMESKFHADLLRKRLRANETFEYSFYIDLDKLETVPEDHGTSHLSIMDSQGNAVSLTSTINGVWGSQVMSPNLGLIYNNQMDDFSTPNSTNRWGLPPSKNNFIIPKKKPLSSMSPTIVLKDGSPYAVLGGSGGSRIITAVLQTLLNLLFHENDLPMAIARPRLHYQLLPVGVDVEMGMNEEIVAELEKRGHVISWKAYGTNAAVQAVVKLDSGMFVGSSDPRKFGEPAAY